MYNLSLEFMQIQRSMRGLFSGKCAGLTEESFLSGLECLVRGILQLKPSEVSIDQMSKYLQLIHSYIQLCNSCLSHLFFKRTMLLRFAFLKIELRRVFYKPASKKVQIISIYKISKLYMMRNWMKVLETKIFP